MQDIIVKMLDERWNKTKIIPNLQSIHYMLPVKEGVADVAMTFLNLKYRINMIKLKEEC